MRTRQYMMHYRVEYMDKDLRDQIIIFVIGLGICLGALAVIEMTWDPDNPDLPPSWNEIANELTEKGGSITYFTASSSTTYYISNAKVWAMTDGLMAETTTGYVHFPYERILEVWVR